MNCKPGDLVIVVKTAPAWRQYLGRITTIVGRDEMGWADWLLELRPDHEGFTRVIANDDQLRPIRGNDGEDEMLRIAGKPKKETSHV